jgi:outer membrane protein OmpA-like peptidoglycan-associated protein
MHNRILILISLVLCFNSIAQQNKSFQSNWQGVLMQGDKNYAYWLKFNIEDKNVKGIARTEIPNSSYFALYNVKGIIKNDTLFFEETSIIKQKIRNKDGFCIIKGFLVIQETQKIKGAWYSNTPNCGAGTLSFNKTLRNINLKENIKNTYIDIDSINSYSQFKRGNRFRLKRVFFKSNSAHLDLKSQQEINKIVDLLNKNNKLNASVIGYTDSDGNDEYNLELSYLRAQNIQQYIISKGIASSRVVYEGYGEANPLVENNSAENKTKNRRVEIELILE